MAANSDTHTKLDIDTAVLMTYKTTGYIYYPRVKHTTCTSWLDHILCTTDFLDCVNHSTVLYDVVVSDHHPIGFNICTSILPECTDTNNEIVNKIKWEKLSFHDIEMYKCATSKKLENVELPDGLKCRNPNCKDVSHRRDISDFYCSINNILKECGEMLLDSKKNKCSEYNIPGWDVMVDDLHDAARKSYLLWRTHGKPRNGHLYDLMKRCKYKFKHAVRKCKNNKNTILADKMASSVSSMNDREFWKTVKTKVNSQVNLSSQIDSHHGQKGNCKYVEKSL